MAMTAWSAKVFSSAIWLSGNGAATSRYAVIVPIGWPSRSSGVESTLRKWAAFATSWYAYSASLPMSGMWTTSRVRTARCVAPPRLGRHG